jgi:hypothetical protein
MEILIHSIEIANRRDYARIDVCDRCASGSTGYVRNGSKHRRAQKSAEALYRTAVIFEDANRGVPEGQPLSRANCSFIVCRVHWNPDQREGRITRPYKACHSLLVGNVFAHRGQVPSRPSGGERKRAAGAIGKP